MARTTNPFFFWRHFLSPGKGAKYGQFWADWIVFGRSAALFNHQKKKEKKTKKTVFSAQKTPTNSTKKTKIKSDTFKGSHKHNFNFPDLWDREVSHIYIRIYSMVYIYASDVLQKKYWWERLLFTNSNFERSRRHRLQVCLVQLPSDNVPSNIPATHFNYFVFFVIFVIRCITVVTKVLGLHHLPSIHDICTMSVSRSAFLVLLLLYFLFVCSPLPLPTIRNLGGCFV